MRAPPQIRSIAVIVATLWAAGCGGAQSPAERGAAAVADGRWSDAYSAYSRAIDRDPTRLELRRERVRAARATGRLSELEGQLREHVADLGTTPAPAYELALAIAVAGEPGSDEQALELLSQVAERLPDEAEVHYRIGLLRIEQERYDLAAAALERAVELEPEVSRFRVALASALAQVPGSEDRAREVLSALPELSPTEADVQRARAVLAGLNNPFLRIPTALQESYREAVAALSEEGASNGEAVQLIEDSLEVAPSCAPFIVLNGLANVRLGQLGWARAAFLRATDLWPDDPVPWIELASLDEAADDLASAEDHLHRALTVDPLSLDGWSEIGRIRYQRQHFAEAAEAFRRLLAIDGGRVLTHLWLGRSLRRAGRDAEAEQVYLAMLERHPRNYEACLQLGHIYRRRRLRAEGSEESAELRDRALHYYRLALDVRPQDPLVERLVNALEESQ